MWVGVVGIVNDRKICLIIDGWRSALDEFTIVGFAFGKDRFIMASNCNRYYFGLGIEFQLTADLIRVEQNAFLCI